MPFTPAYIAPPAPPKKNYRFSWVRVLVIGVMLSVLVAVCLYLHHTSFATLTQGLADAEHKSSAWIAEEIGYLLPFLVICLFQLAVYQKHDRQNGVLQKEMAWEIVILAVLTYGVLLPVVVHMSDTQLSLKLAVDVVIEKNDGNVYPTLFMDVLEWFVRLAVPVLFLLVFHTAKAHTELSLCQAEVQPSAPCNTPIEETISKENPQSADHTTSP